MASRLWRVVLVGSLALNVLLLSVAGYVFYRKGGLRYLRNYRAIVKGDAVTIDNFPMYYQQKYSTFWAEPITPGRVILAGDSLTEQHDWTSACGPDIVNRGIGADNSVGLLFRMGEILRHRPRKLFLLIGISDLRIGRKPERILETYRRIIDRVRTEAPKTKLFVQSLLPINPAMFGSEISLEDVRRVNAGLRELTRDRGAVYVDVFSRLLANDVLDPRYTVEGVHLKPAGYQRWEEALQAVNCR